VNGVAYGFAAVLRYGRILEYNTGWQFVHEPDRQHWSRSKPRMRSESSGRVHTISYAALPGMQNGRFPIPRCCREQRRLPHCSGQGNPRQPGEFQLPCAGFRYPPAGSAANIRHTYSQTDAAVTLVWDNAVDAADVDYYRLGYRMQPECSISSTVLPGLLRSYSQWLTWDTTAILKCRCRRTAPGCPVIAHRLQLYHPAKAGSVAAETQV